MKGTEAINNNAGSDIIQMAKKKRHIFLLEKMQKGKTLTKKELEELEQFENAGKKKPKPLAKQKEKGNIVTGVPAVARAIGCSARTVRNWIGEGMPELGGKRFDVDAIKAWRIERDNRRKNDEINRYEIAIKKAQLLKLNLENQGRQADQLEEIRKVAFDQGRKLRDSCFAIPDRVSALLAAETDPVKISEILMKELTDVFLNIGNLNNVKN